MTDKELSRQYHSIRLYTGEYTSKNISYRIGDTTTTVADKTEIYYDTWINFHLIPTARPTVTLPTANTKLINIPGRSTPIDLSTYLTGHQIFGNRTGSWSFYTDIDFMNDRYGGWLNFQNILLDLFHGKMIKAVLVDDPAYFYFGELTMGQLQVGRDWSTISISYNFYPYKKSMISSLDMWKWDDFDFDESVITYLKDIEVSGSRTIEIIGSRERISPYISGSSGLQIAKYENSGWKEYGAVPTYPIASSKSIIPGLVIDYGINKIRFQGNGNVTIDYRRGLL